MSSPRKLFIEVVPCSVTGGIAAVDLSGLEGANEQNFKHAVSLAKRLIAAPAKTVAWYACGQNHLVICPAAAGEPLNVHTIPRGIRLFFYA